MTALSLMAAKRQALARGLDAIDVDALLCSVIKKDRTYLFTWPETLLTAEQLSLYERLIERRIAGEPIAYLTGEREFWSLPIKTNTSTLIPRADTEILVEAVLSHVSEQPKVCFDLGTGTGAIALALKSERQSWDVTGIDRVSSAVQLAQENAAALGLSVNFMQGYWLEGMALGSIDIIVSNPPYIDIEDTHLSEGDVRFEPRSALVADEKGFADIALIIKQSVTCLTSGGSLFLEHGWQQAAHVRHLLIEAGFKNVTTVNDYGGNERVSFGVLSK